MELFPKIVNAKCFILDVWQGSECASAWICYISKCSFTATSRKTKNFSESCRENNSFFQLYPRIKFWLFLTYLCSFDSKINFILSKEQIMKQNTFQVLPDNWFWISHFLSQWQQRSCQGRNKTEYLLTNCGTLKDIIIKPHLMDTRSTLNLSKKSVFCS